MEGFEIEEKTMLNIDTNIICEQCVEGGSFFPTSSVVHSRVVLVHSNMLISQKSFLFLLPNDKLNIAKLSESIKDFFFYDQESFISVGAISDINKKKKLILLTAGHVISYEYLIMVSDNESPSKAYNQQTLFRLGVQSLIDALRVKENVNSCLHAFATKNYTEMNFRNEYRHAASIKERDSAHQIPDLAEKYIRRGKTKSFHHQPHGNAVVVC